MVDVRLKKTTNLSISKSNNLLDLAKKVVYDFNKT
jgi:hypothetical protein